MAAVEEEGLQGPEPQAQEADARTEKRHEAAADRGTDRNQASKSTALRGHEGAQAAWRGLKRVCAEGTNAPGTHCAVYLISQEVIIHAQRVRWMRQWRAVGCLVGVVAHGSSSR